MAGRTGAGRARRRPGRCSLDLSDRLHALALLGAAWTPPAEPALWRRHAAWANAGIEGNPVAWPEADAILSDEPDEAPGLPERELRGCLRLLEFLDEGLPATWSLGLIRHLHELLMAGVARQPGALRGHPVKIVRESGPRRGETVFEPPHPLQVPELLAALLDTLDPEEDPFLQSGRFHYEFQSIHPFGDGNGRLGRVLSTALARRGWDARGFYLAPAVRRAGAAYYLALRAVRPDYQSEPRDGLRPWLLPYLDIVADALSAPAPPGP